MLLSSSATVSVDIPRTPGLAGFPVHTGSSVGQATFFVNNTSSSAVTAYVWGRVAGGATTGTWQLIGVAEPFIFVAY